MKGTVKNIYSLCAVQATYKESQSDQMILEESIVNDLK